MNQNGADVPSTALLAAWSDLESEIGAHRSDLNLSFGLEYSSVVDWAADITPRRGHPKARQYGEVWRGQGTTAAEAISRAIRAMRDELTANAQISGGTPSAESDCSTEYPHYHADCPKCGKRTVWRDPREYGDTIGCMRCGHEIELSNPTGLGTTHKPEDRT